MKRYNPEEFKNTNDITMEDVEAFYNTSILRPRTESIIVITAPLLVCMALHGKLDEIEKLLKKFPLVDASGWTPELEQEERVCKKSSFFMLDRTGKRSIQVPDGLSTTFTLAFSEQLDIKEYQKFKKIEPLKLEWEDVISKILDDDVVLRLKYDVSWD